MARRASGLFKLIVADLMGNRKVTTPIAWPKDQTRRFRCGIRSNR